MAATRTVRDILTRALRVAGVVGSGETPDANDANDALISFNQMIDAWQAERLFAYAVIERTHALTAGLGVYTIGAGATINAPRPIRIEWAFTRDFQNYDRPVQVVPDDYFAQITLKDLGNIFPSVLYYEPTYPNGIINLWPLPPTSLTLHIGVWDVVSEFADLNATVSCPPGYEDAYVYSMVERICPEYGKPVTADIVRLAQRARANIQQNNLPELAVSCEFTGGDRSPISYWDVVAGDY